MNTRIDPISIKADTPAIPLVHVTLVPGPLAARDVPRVEGAGAVIVFEGVVRPREDGQPIDGLLYEAYEPMTSRMLHDLATSTANRFELLGVMVEHSVGFVPAHGCSFRLVVASKHRAEAMAAMEWFIDEMKREIPLWKHPRLTQSPASTETGS